MRPATGAAGRRLRRAAAGRRPGLARRSGAARRPRPTARSTPSSTSAASPTSRTFRRATSATSRFRAREPRGFSLGPVPKHWGYDGLIGLTAREHQVQPALVKAVIAAESNFDPGAVSRKGAQGLMQLMPGDGRAARDRRSARAHRQRARRHPLPAQHARSLRRPLAGARGLQRRADGGGSLRRHPALSARRRIT